MANDKSNAQPFNLETALKNPTWVHHIHQDTKPALAVSSNDPNEVTVKWPNGMKSHTYDLAEAQQFLRIIPE